MRLDLTPHARATHWTARYVGLPRTDSYTCWEMVRAVQLHEFVRALPPFTPGAAADELLRLVDAAGWRAVLGDVVRLARDGDVLLMSGPDGPHIGVVTLRAGHPPCLLHNIGGKDDKGRTWGSVRIDAIEALGGMGYGHLRLWRAAP